MSMLNPFRLRPLPPPKGWKPLMSGARPDSKKEDKNSTPRTLPLPPNPFRSSSSSSSSNGNSSKTSLPESGLDIRHGLEYTTVSPSTPPATGICSVCSNISTNTVDGFEFCDSCFRVEHWAYPAPPARCSVCYAVVAVKKSYPPSAYKNPFVSKKEEKEEKDKAPIVCLRCKKRFPDAAAAAAAAMKPVARVEERPSTSVSRVRSSSNPFRSAAPVPPPPMLEKKASKGSLRRLSSKASLLSLTTSTKRCLGCNEHFPSSEFPKHAPSKLCRHKAEICRGCQDKSIVFSMWTGLNEPVRCIYPGCGRLLSVDEVRNIAKKDTFASFESNNMALKPGISSYEKLRPPQTPATEIFPLNCSLCGNPNGAESLGSITENCKHRRTVCFGCVNDSITNLLTAGGSLQRVRCVECGEILSWSDLGRVTKLGGGKLSFPSNGPSSPSALFHSAIGTSTVRRGSLSHAPPVSFEMSRTFHPVATAPDRVLTSTQQTVPEPVHASTIGIAISTPVLIPEDYVTRDTANYGKSNNTASKVMTPVAQQTVTYPHLPVRNDDDDASSYYSAADYSSSSGSSTAGSTFTAVSPNGSSADTSVVSSPNTSHTASTPVKTTTSRDDDKILVIADETEKEVVQQPLGSFGIVDLAEMALGQLAQTVQSMSIGQGKGKQKAVPVPVQVETAAEREMYAQKDMQDAMIRYPELPDFEAQLPPPLSAKIAEVEGSPVELPATTKTAEEKAERPPKKRSLSEILAEIYGSVPTITPETRSSSAKGKEKAVEPPAVVVVEEPPKPVTAAASSALNFLPTNPFSAFFRAATPVAAVAAPPSPRPSPAPSSSPPRIPEIKCSVCLDTLPLSTFPTRRFSENCEHEPSTCKPCIAEHIRHQLDSRGVSLSPNNPSSTGLTCPECSTDLSHSDVQEFATPDVFARFDALVLRNAVSAAEENFRWCMSEGCGDGQIHERGEDEPIVICHSCGGKSCFKHQVPWHEGMTCNQYDGEEEELYAVPSNETAKSKANKNSQSWMSWMFNGEGSSSSGSSQVEADRRLAEKLEEEDRKEHERKMKESMKLWKQGMREQEEKHKRDEEATKRFLEAEKKAEQREEQKKKQEENRRKQEEERRRQEEERRVQAERAEAERKKKEVDAAAARARRRQEEEASKQTVANTSKPCPGCGWGITKEGGCDHMTCRKCHHEFCWLCFADYKPIRNHGNSRHKATCRYHA